MTEHQLEVRGDVRLPASREAMTLATADGLTLVAELASPVGRSAAATLVLLHPLPTHGGSSDSHLYRKAANRLPALAGLAVLRLNTRGTVSSLGRSEGAFDFARSERYDVAAAIEAVDFGQLPAPWLVGWSFGTDLALMHGCDPTVSGAVLLSPPLRYTTEEDLNAWAVSGKPVIALVPGEDDYLKPAEAARRFARIPQAQVRGFPGVKHLWVGESAVRLALDAVVEAVLPGSTPLPTTYSAASVD